MDRRARTRGDEARDADAGSTLVEVLIATVLMGSAIIVLVTGMSTLFSSSIQNRQATTAGLVARDYAEALVVAVAAVPATDPWCSTTPYAVAYTAPAGYSVTTTAAGCPANDTTTPQFQPLVITATSPTGRTETLRVVVRKS
jgi:type II secretory pathway pseudopilin PulG